MVSSTTLANDHQIIGFIAYRLLKFFVQTKPLQMKSRYWRELVTSTLLLLFSHVLNKGRLSLIATSKVVDLIRQVN